MNADTRLLLAVIKLAESELELHGNDSDRTGALRALMKEALPFLKRLYECGSKEVAHG